MRPLRWVVISPRGRSDGKPGGMLGLIRRYERCEGSVSLKHVARTSLVKGGLVAFAPYIPRGLGVRPWSMEAGRVWPRTVAWHDGLGPHRGKAESLMAIECQSRPDPDGEVNCRREVLRGGAGGKRPFRRRW